MTTHETDDGTSAPGAAPSSSRESHSDSTPAAAPRSSPGPSHSARDVDSSASVSTKRHRFGVEDLAFIALLILSLIGMAVADYSATSGLSYWLVMIPLFAAFSVYSGWRRAKAAGEKIEAMLLSQLLHWGALTLAVYLIYLLERTGRLNREDAGLVALLSLALATVLAGVHFDWRLIVLGVLLALATAGAALVEEFFWIMLVPAVVAGAIVVWWQRRSRRARATEPH